MNATTTTYTVTVSLQDYNSREGLGGYQHSEQLGPYSTLEAAIERAERYSPDFGSRYHFALITVDALQGDEIVQAGLYEREVEA